MQRYLKRQGENTIFDQVFFERECYKRMNNKESKNQKKKKNKILIYKLNKFGELALDYKLF